MSVKWVVLYAAFDSSLEELLKPLQYALYVLVTGKRDIEGEAWVFDDAASAAIEIILVCVVFYLACKFIRWLALAMKFRLRTSSNHRQQTS